MVDRRRAGGATLQSETWVLAVGFLPMQFLNTEGPWSYLQGEEFAPDALEDWTVERVKFLLGGALEKNLIAHDERWVERSVK